MAHMHVKMDFTSEVFVVHKNKVLLRRHDKYNIWLSVGGHIEIGEDPIEAALREVEEEVGLDIEIWGGRKEFFVDEATFRNLIPPAALNRHTAGEGHEHVTFVYFATAQTNALVLEHEEDECRWVSQEELMSMDLLPNVREYAEGALKALAE